MSQAKSLKVPPALRKKLQNQAPVEVTYTFGTGGRLCLYTMILLAIICFGCAAFFDNVRSIKEQARVEFNAFMDDTIINCRDLAFSDADLYFSATASCLSFTGHYIVEDQLYNTKIITDNYIGGTCTATAIRVQMLQFTPVINWGRVTEIKTSWQDLDIIDQPLLYKKLPDEKRNLRWEWPGNADADHGWNIIKNQGPMYFVQDSTNQDVKIHMLPSSYPNAMFTSPGELVDDEKVILPIGSSVEKCISHAQGKLMAASYPLGLTSQEYLNLALDNTEKFPNCLSAAYGDYKLTATCMLPTRNASKRRVIAAVILKNNPVNATEKLKAIDGWKGLGEKYNLFIWSKDLSKSTHLLLTEYKSNEAEKITVLIDNAARTRNICAVLAVGIMLITSFSVNYLLTPRPVTKRSISKPDNSQVSVMDAKAYDEYQNDLQHEWNTRLSVSYRVD